MWKNKDKTQNETNASAGFNADELGEIFYKPTLFSWPISWPFSPSVSGLYEWHWRLKLPISVHPRIPKPAPRPTGLMPYESLENGEDDDEITMTNEKEALFPCLPWQFKREELRLDVDGRYPQMTASGAMFSGSDIRVNWIASLVKIGRNQWSGDIWYKHGDTDILPYTKVSITSARKYFFWSRRKVTVAFSGGGGTPRTITYKYVSKYFHPVEFEFDRVEGAPIVTSVKTTSHPNHPAGLRSEKLKIEDVYRRAGFQVRKSGDDDTIPLSMANVGARWSDIEMHDAMQVYWSRFADKAQWSMWTLFASLHDLGTALGGIMFDRIGTNHRQGTAVFGDAFIADAPSGDEAPDAWIRRNRFWTACHEIGHCFNLAHSWQKEMGTSWIPIQDEDEARSFMNYPYIVSGGQSAFFADFDYRFSDSELLFMRHAPSKYVQMGNAAWFDHHGFQQANVSDNPEYKLEIRVNRNKPIFEFLEPVILELKLTNDSSEPQLFDSEILSSGHDIIVIVKKEGMDAKQWAPFAKYCSAPNPTEIEPKKSIYHSLFVSADVDGWNIDEPGMYLIQVAIKNREEYIISNPLTIQVAPPHGDNEEFIAQDVFSEDVGRVLGLNGSRFLKTANNTLGEVVARLPKSRLAYHAGMALGNPLSRDFKLLTLDDGKSIEILKKDAEGAKRALSAALTDTVSEAAETLGHINYKNKVDSYCEFLSGEGADDVAAKCQEAMQKEFTARHVLPSVLQQIHEARKGYESKS